MSSIFFRTVIIFVLLSASMKFMGKREIGELEVGELITTLLVSEVCSIPIDDPDIPLMNAVIPVLFIVSIEIIISHIKNKSRKLKRIFDGKPVFLIKGGKLNQSALYENRISVEEFMTSIRQNGVGSIDEISDCILEANGKISVLKNGTKLAHVIISDGEVNFERLYALGFDEKWLKKKLCGIAYDRIFIMSADSDGSVYIIKKEKKR